MKHILPIITITTLAAAASAQTAAASSGLSYNGVDSVSLGYVFKNVALGADATVSVGSDEAYGLNVRKDLGNNIELAVAFERQSGVNVWGAELAYNVSKQIQVAVGYSDASGSASTTDISVRYNF